MTSFADNFWGEKNNGFFVLYHNMKHGQTSVKELGDCLRETLSIEESHSKLLNKLTKSIANASAVGTFSPFWAVWKAFIEKLSSLHMQMMHTCSDLLKDMVRYNEEQHKKHKTMKENEQPTLEAVQGIQATLTGVHRAKEIYHTRCIERERLKRENASAKEIEKAEQKYKKAHDEYKSWVEKYQTVKATFEKKMMESCRHFQELEEEHICQMKDFVDTYVKAWENQHVLLGQVQNEFKVNCEELTVQKLIDRFMEAKSTGKERPGPIEFVEPDLSSLPSPPTRPMSPDPGASDKRDSFTEKQKQEPVATGGSAISVSLPDSSGSPSPVLSDQPGPLSRSVKLRVSRTWFLKNKNKKKEKKAKKKKEKDEKDSESLDAESQGDAPEVDEDGFRIRPDNPMDNNGDKNSWYSSDSDSDSDGEDSRRKIKVAIRPLSPTNAAPASSNVEDIRASVQGLSLSPTAVRKRSHTPVDKKMKRSQSESDTLDKPNQDLLNLDFFNSSSSASTPTGANYSLPSPLSPQTEINWNLTSAPLNSQPLASPNNLTDLLSTPNDNSNGGLSTTTTPTSSQVTSPTSGSLPQPGPVPPRPSSRNRGVIPPAIPQLLSYLSTPNQQQPAKPQNGPVPPLSRSDSGSTFSTTSMPVGSSRGPSPLTIGMSDTIPLAVAFTDTVNAFFKGTDATKCTVRVNGVLHMSFPIGIIKVFTDNPNPPLLSFRLKNTAKIEQMDSSGLVSKDESLSTAENTVFIFDMPALKEHLRKQGEQGKTAYYTVEILRYQVKNKPGVESTPLPLVVYWKCEENSSEWRLDYRYNAAAMSCPATLKNVNVVVGMPPDAEVAKMKSHPVTGKWDSETRRATWKLNDISEVSEQESQGFIRAKFDLKGGGPIKPLTTMLQFGAEGANLSGTDFELVGSGYRISLTKKRFCTGKYYADPEPSISYV